MELEVNWAAGTECLWRRVEWVARAVKREDPNHPVGTVLAGLHPDKVANIAALCPSIEFLGVNVYGDGSLTVGSQLASFGWDKPYAITEYGPRGHWEAPRTSWGSYVEETSSQKKYRYSKTCQMCAQDDQCVGTFAFYWGWKWEKTGTWYGMFNEWDAVTKNITIDCPDCESEVVATMQECWTGHSSTNSPPSIVGVRVDDVELPNMQFKVEPNSLVNLQVMADHPNSKELTAVWAITEEIVSDAVGGAYERTNGLLHGLWPEHRTEATGTGLSISLDTSALALGSSYRLYVFVRETGESPAIREAHASLPFHICHDALLGEHCYNYVAYALHGGIAAHPGAYPGVNASSSLADVQMMMYQKGVGSCPMPCRVRDDWCHTSVDGEECYGLVQKIMNATQGSSFMTAVEIQQQIYEHRSGVCTKPCQISKAEGKDTLSTKEDVTDLDLSGANEVCHIMGLVTTVLAFVLRLA